MISIKIKDPIFTYHAQLINILGFNPKKVLKRYVLLTMS